MDGDEPAGGRWNFDRENREPAAGATRRPPSPYRPREDEIDEEVRADLDAHGPTARFGDDGPRLFPATRDEALPRARPLRRAPAAGLRAAGRTRCSTATRFMAHALAVGAAQPRPARPARRSRGRRAAPTAPGHAPISAVEGFVRQVIGWREYMWGIYWLHAERLALDERPARAAGACPRYLWSGDTEMRCVADSVDRPARDRLRPPHPAPDGVRAT